VIAVVDGAATAAIFSPGKWFSPSTSFRGTGSWGSLGLPIHTSATGVFSSEMSRMRRNVAFFEQGKEQAAQIEGVGGQHHILNGGGAGQLITYRAVFLEHIHAAFFGIAHHRHQNGCLQEKIHFVGASHVQPLCSMAHVLAAVGFRINGLFLSGDVITMNCQGWAFSGEAP
jgi:hypothetical protein